MAQRAEKMTDEMKTFRNKIFSGYIYINIFWVVVCSLVQIFGHKITILVFPESFVSLTVL